MRTIRLFAPAAMAVAVLAFMPVTAGANPTSSVSSHPDASVNPKASPPHRDFGTRQIGTTSAKKSITLTLYCDENAYAGCLFVQFQLFYPSIYANSAFSQTNDCPATMAVANGAPPQSCTIKVSFKPTKAGPVKGTLDTGDQGPIVALSGIGTKKCKKSEASTAEKGPTTKKYCNKRKRKGKPKQYGGK